MLSAETLFNEQIVWLIRWDKQALFPVNRIYTYILICPPQGIFTGPRSAVGNVSADTSLTADLGVASSIPARSHTFVEIGHEIISTVILLPLQAKVCTGSTG